MNTIRSFYNRLVWVIAGLLIAFTASAQINNQTTFGSQSCTSGNGPYTIGLSTKQGTITYYVKNQYNETPIYNGSPLQPIDALHNFSTVQWQVQHVGTYRIYGEYTSSGTGDRIVGTVTITAPVPVSNSHSISRTDTNGDLCASETATIRLGSSQSGVSYRLFKGGTADSNHSAKLSTGTGPLTWNITSASGSGSYTVKGSNSCYSDVAMGGTVSLTFDTAPSATYYTGGGDICSGSTSNITVYNTQGNGVRYQLFLNNTFYDEKTAIGGGAGLSWNNLTAQGTYTVKAVSQFGCGLITLSNNNPNSAPADVNVFYKPAKYTLSDTGDGSYCWNETTNLRLSGIQSGITYTLLKNGSPAGIAPTTITENSVQKLNWAITDPGQSGNISYTVRAVRSTGPSACNTETMNGTVTLSFDTEPALKTVTGGGDICSGTSADITLGSPQAGILYRLYRGGSLHASYQAPSSPPANYSWSVTTDGNYAVKAVSGNGCEVLMTNNSTEVKNYAEPTPQTVNFSSDGTLCFDKTATITLSGSENGVKYRLKKGSSYVSGQATHTGNANGDGYTWTINKGDNTGNYTVEAERPGAPASCKYKTMTGSKTFEFDTAPISTYFTGGGEFCTGSTATITVHNTQGSGVRYQLFKDGLLDQEKTAIGGGAGLSFPNLAYGGNYTVKAVSKFGCGLITLTNNSSGVEFFSKPTKYTFSDTGDGSYCWGESTNLRLSGIESNVTYTLLKNGSPAGIAPTTITEGGVQKLNWALTDPGNSGTINYTVRGIRSTGPTACNSEYMTGTVSLTFDDQPALKAITGGGDICSGTNANIILTSPQANVLYRLYRGGSLQASYQAPSSPPGTYSWGVSTDGNYSVRAVSANGCETPMTNNSTEVKNYSKPTELPVVLSGDGTYCWGENAVLTITNAQPNIDYILRKDLVAVSGQTKSRTTPGVLTWTITNTAALGDGTYSIEATTGEGPVACQSETMTDYHSLTFIAEPQQFAVFGGGGTCAGGTVDIRLQNSEDGVSYQLYRGTDPLQIITSNGGGELIWSTGLSGTYSVKAIAGGSCNDVLMTGNLSSPVTIEDKPQMPQSYDQKICGSGTATFVADSESGTSIRWYNTSGDLLQDGGSTFTTPVLTADTDYIVKALNNGCESDPLTVTADVDEVAQPPVPVLDDACGNHYLEITASAPADIIYYWQGTDSNGTTDLYPHTEGNWPVRRSGTYYVRSFDTVLKCWSLPVAKVVTLTDPVINKPEGCSTGITAGFIYQVPDGYTPTEGVTNKVYNYARQYEAQEQGLTTTSIKAQPKEDVLVTTGYTDGLGRDLQSVNHEFSPDGFDMVQPFQYDKQGLASRGYMAYASDGQSGAMRLDPFEEQKAKLAGRYTGENVFYARTVMEKSPLSRVMKQMAPGNAWAGSNVGVGTVYSTNTATDDVRLWTLDISGLPESANPYQAGQLYINISVDEEQNQIKTYTDKRGNIVLKKHEDTATGEGHTGWLSTYYIHDVYGNLAYVLPPKAVELLEAANWVWNSTELEPLVYGYDYDGLKRLVTSKVPGAGRTDMVYDKLDRLVLTQDANQRDDNEWTFTKYDVQNRDALSGFITTANGITRSDLQTEADTSTVFYASQEAIDPVGATEAENISVSTHQAGTQVYRANETIMMLPGFDSRGEEFEAEISTTMSFDQTHEQGYHDASFPKLADYDHEVIAVTYYDSYDFTEKTYNSVDPGFYAEDGDENATVPTLYEHVTGQVTGLKVKVLGSENDWLTTVNFYDDRGRTIQTQAENHLGGEDITTIQFDFSGRPLHTYLQHTNPLDAESPATSVLTQMKYDHGGRLKSVKKKLNDTGSFKSVIQNDFNELGEHVNQKLGESPVNSANPLEEIDFDFNIQGWITGINKGYVEGTVTDRYFGMSLDYAQGFAKTELTGSVSGVKWKSKSLNKIRAYGYKYDAVNRLVSADYTQNETAGWNQSMANFSADYDYDANGNITVLNRKTTVFGETIDIDQLTYFYKNGNKSNQLDYIKDQAGHVLQGDYNGDLGTSTDYTYDANGNMISDDAKNIMTDGITYNHHNKPVQIIFGGNVNKTVTYTYNALGDKLAKTVNDNGTITRTDYIGGFIYENNKLQQFAHEEGRVRKSGASLVYDYYIKDNLENTRMTITEEVQTTPTVYMATMEQAYRDFETNTATGLGFGAIGANNTEVNGDANHTVDTQLSPGPDMALRTNGSYAHLRVGATKILKVMTDDVVNVEAYAHYVDNTDNGGSALGITSTILSQAFGGQAGGSSTESAIDNMFTGAFPGIALAQGSPDVNNKKAYLNWILFDEEFNVINSGTGFDQVTTAAESTEDEHLFSGNITVPTSGYFYVYVSNESATTVYFDDVRIEHTRGQILQEDDYYPFGLNINARSHSAPMSQLNKFKYNGMEQQTDFDLNWYDYGARMYMPEIGRWGAVDPLAEGSRRWSPYVYSFNNPIIFKDPDGMWPTWKKAGKWLRRNVVDNIPVVGGVVNGVEKAIEGDWAGAAMSFGEAAIDGVLLVTTGGAGNIAKAGLKTAGNVLIREVVENAVANEVVGALESIGVDPLVVTAVSVVAGGSSKSKSGGGGGPSSRNKPSKACGCFTADTQVLTDEGSKDIDKIEEGDLVWAYDEKTGERALKEVINTFIRERDHIYRIYVDDEIIEATNDHPFLVGNKWLIVEELSAGEELTLYDGRKVNIDSITYEKGSFEVFNFEVQDYHTYFVSDGNVLVHNTSCSTSKKGNVSTGAGRDHVAYTGTTPDGKPYSGYASAPSDMNLTDAQIIERRYNGDFSKFGDKAPVAVNGSRGSGTAGKAKARGIEQKNYQDMVDQNGIDGVANRQNPVGPNNKRKDEYMKAAGADYDHKTKSK